MIKQWFATLGLTVSTLSFGGGVGSSGGGFAVVCRTAEGSIGSAELLDLYEGRASGLTLRTPTGNATRDYGIYLKYLRAAADDSRQVGEEELKYFDDSLARYFVFYPKGTTIGTTSDLGEIPDVPQGCQIEQLAVYHDEVHRVDVSEEIWSALDSLNQVALFAHESLYYMYRVAGEKTSQTIRKLVPQFFVTQLPLSQTSGVPKGSARCFANNLHSDAHWDSHFYYYANPTSPGSTILQFNNLLGRYTLSPLRISIPYLIQDSQLELRYGDDNQTYMAVLDPTADFVQSIVIGEGAFAGYSVIVHYQYLRPFGVTLVSPQGVVDTHHSVRHCFAATETSAENQK